MLLNLDGLTSLIAAVGYANYVFDLRGVEFAEPVSTLRLSLLDTEGSGGRVDFSLAISGLVAFDIRSCSWLSACELRDTHPLLLHYQEPHGSLYLKGRTERVKELAFDLFTIHQAVYGHWRPFNPRILDVLRWEHGLLAEGPQVLLQRYADTLEAYGIQPSLLIAYTPGPSELSILTLDDSYFIGTRFEVMGEGRAGA